VVHFICYSVTCISRRIDIAPQFINLDISIYFSFEARFFPSKKVEISLLIVCRILQLKIKIALRSEQLVLFIPLSKEYFHLVLLK
jgi:hypothetical protein